LKAVRWFASLPRSAQAGAFVIAMIFALGLIIPAVSPYGAFATVAPAVQPPSLAHPFGTDNLGRDLLTRSFAASTLDLTIAVVGVSVPLFIGTALGAVAGTTRIRGVHTTIGVVVDGINAFPFLILALGIIAIVGTGVAGVIIAIGVTGWARYAKIARTKASALRDLDFVNALRLLGYGPGRIVLRHILPNCFRETAAYGVSDATHVILTVAAMSFLGAGVIPPAAEWGAMMSDGRVFFFTAPWLVLGPGLVLCTTAFGVSMLGEALKGDAR
jgi:peptide/nickel transport system permease protein